MTRTTGTSTWIDASVTDLESAKTFYSGLFGWEFEDLGESFGHYHLVRNNGALVGGLMDVSGMTCPDGEPLVAEWGVHLAVDDVDARAATATSRGARLVMPIEDIGSFGRSGTILDPTEALVGMWQARDLEGYEFTGDPGSPVWFELMTHEFDAASAFYTAVFDANLVPMGEPMDDDSFRYSTNGPGESASWGLGDATGVMPKEATGWRVYFGVEASEAALAKVTELGGTVLDGPVDSPFGRIATIADPSGASFQISAMSEAVAEG
ncbi:MAG: VOC family protein [Brachybacterium sp.]|uniref:VOC family protein n=1 Tax=Brachybacterium sp. TaxID=1891286 RepID=UPI002648F4CF|nr:VOC family protein [Brachybacterium sp.]MDN5686275.1 VOC family protein [Brachybacterium sp.]